LRPRDPVDIAGPRPLAGVVVRPLNFTVRRQMSSVRDLGARFREAFAADLASAPPMTLRQGDAIDSYGQEPPRDDAADAATDAYLERYRHGLAHLDSTSWRHYLPVLADYAQRHLRRGTMVIDSLIMSLRPPDRDPPRLGSLSAVQEAAVRTLLELLAFSPESTWQTQACQALEEWWIEDPLHRPKAGRGDAV